MASRPFIAARLEERFNRVLNRMLRRFGWREATFAYTGYGSSDFVRVLGRLVLSPRPATMQNQFLRQLIQQRGWRNFINVPVVHGRVRITLNGTEHIVTTDRGGYVDVRLPSPGLEPGWHEVEIGPLEEEAMSGRVNIIGDDERFGLVSDIDDTVISTSLPRLFIAAWNTFVIHESARQAVAGMSELYRVLVDAHPGAPVFYLSTGAWNTAPTLSRFLRHHRYPNGVLLLTDWGPTNTGWFRSGQDHKRASLAQLARDFPRISWVLIGDDGQHDPSLYAEFASEHPDQTRVVVIRELSPAEQVLSHGSLLAMDEAELARRRRSADDGVVRGGDGYTLRDRLAERLDEVRPDRRG